MVAMAGVIHPMNVLLAAFRKRSLALPFREESAPTVIDVFIAITVLQDHQEVQQEDLEDLEGVVEEVEMHHLRSPASNSTGKGHASTAIIAIIAMK